MSVYLDVLDDKGKTQIVSLDSLAALLEEAGLELELSAPRVSSQLFDHAARIRTTWGVTGLPQLFPATCTTDVCGVDSDIPPEAAYCCPGCGGTGCPACQGENKVV